MNKIMRYLSLSKRTPWFLADDIPLDHCVAVYQPKGAANLAASYINLINPGTHDAIPEIAPGFDPDTAWDFNGSTQKLITDITPGSSWTVITALSDVINSDSWAFGLYDTSGFGLQPCSLNYNVYYNGAILELNTIRSNGNWVIADRDCYFCGASDGILAAGTPSQLPIHIGDVNWSGGHRYYNGKMAAWAIYDIKLSNIQIEAVITRMLDVLSPRSGRFTRYSAAPQLKTVLATWESGDVAAPDIFYDTPNDRWVMVYSGYNGSIWCTGLAYSSDLITWTKEATNPILSPISGEGYIAANGTIVLKGDTYYLYYQDATPEIRCATSTDLLNWTRQGVVIASGEVGEWDNGGVFDACAQLMSGGNTIEILYIGNDLNRALGRATSTNGLNFTKQGKMFDHPDFAPHNFGVPGFYREDQNNMLILFDGAMVNGYRSIHSAKTINGGADWTFEQNVFVKRPYSWDHAQVFDANFLINNGEIYLFYSGSLIAGEAQGMKSCIGLAQCPWTSIAGW